MKAIIVKDLWEGGDENLKGVVIDIFHIKRVVYSTTFTPLTLLCSIESHTNASKATHERLLDVGIDAENVFSDEECKEIHERYNSYTQQKLMNFVETLLMAKMYGI